MKQVTFFLFALLLLNVGCTKATMFSDSIIDPTIDSVVVKLYPGNSFPVVTRTLTIKGNSLGHLQVGTIIDSSPGSVQQGFLLPNDARQLTDAVNRVFVTHSAPDVLPWSIYALATDHATLHIELYRKGMSASYEYYLGFKGITYSPELKGIIACAYTQKWPENATTGTGLKGMRQQPDSIEINFSKGDDEHGAQLYTWMVYKNGKVSYREEIGTQHDADSPNVVSHAFYKYSPYTNAAKIHTLVNDILTNAHGTITQANGEKLCTPHPDNISITVDNGPRYAFYAYNLQKKGLRYSPQFNQLVQRLQANTKHKNSEKRD